jgi:hypothetical protein
MFSMGHFLLDLYALAHFVGLLLPQVLGSLQFVGRHNLQVLLQGGLGLTGIEQGILSTRSVFVVRACRRIQSAQIGQFGAQVLHIAEYIIAQQVRQALFRLGECYIET